MTIGARIYVDADLCARFGVSYHAKDAAFAVSASRLLASHDYDEAHRAILAPLGERTIRLVRREDSMPGWFEIEEVYGSAQFITDAGGPVIITWGDKERDIGRYGVWGDKGHWTGKAEVMDTSNDLDALRARHGDVPVHALPRR